MSKETYYSKNRAYRIEKTKEIYYAKRAEKLAYQKEYTAKRRAAGWVPKNYPRKSRAKPKPEPKVILIPLPDEPEPPLTQVQVAPKAGRSKKPPPAPFTWTEASFSMLLN